MISTELNINKNKLHSYRDPVGFCFAKWFDEQFIYDILNEVGFKDFKFVLASDSEDRNHIDMYASNGSERVTIDCKIMNHNFEYNNGHENKKLKTSYDDVLTIGQYALASENTEYIMFVRRDTISICSLRDIRDKVKPLVVISKSKGIAGNAQDLYNYRVKDLQNLFSTHIISIPSDKADLYDKAFKLYDKSRFSVREIHFNKNLSEEKKTEMIIIILEDLKRELLGIINEYNNIYVEIPKIDNTDDLLNDIYNL